MTDKAKDVSLRPLTDDNREAVEALRVSPAPAPVRQRRQGLARRGGRRAGRHAIYWAVYAGETPVGFVMIADEVDSPEYIPHYLWKLLIDERHQRRGYGTATLDLIVEYFRDRPASKS